MASILGEIFHFTVHVAVCVVICEAIHAYAHRKKESA